MTQISQSRVVAALGHRNSISVAKPFIRPEDRAVKATVDGLININKLERDLPDGWNVSNVSNSLGETRIHIFPD